MRPLAFERLFSQCAALAGILFVVVIIALKAGAVEVSLFALGRDLIRGIVHHGGEKKNDYGLIVMNIRLPRILLGIFVGASLAVAGTGFQALLRNPLADPYVLGVSNGAPLGAFLGAAATIAAVYFLGRREGQIDSTTLLLGGVITGSFLAAIIMFLMTSETGSNLRGMAYWLMGNLSTSLQPSVYWILWLGFLLGAGAIYTTASDLNLLLSGEKEAMHLGVDLPRVRLVVYIAASLLTGLAVSVSGSIGYVGLLVPHVMRQIFGSDHRVLLPTAAFGGAIAVVIADTIGRTVVPPAEVPVGAMTALAGAPLFIYLLRRRMA